MALTNKCGGVTGLRGGQELEYRRRQPNTVSARRSIVTEEKVSHLIQPPTMQMPCRKCVRADVLCPAATELLPTKPQKRDEACRAARDRGGLHGTVPCGTARDCIGLGPCWEVQAAPRGCCVEGSLFTPGCGSSAMSPKLGALVGVEVEVSVLSRLQPGARRVSLCMSM